MNKNKVLRVRVRETEEAAFQSAAELSGLSLSSWVRERLRRIAAKELQDGSLPVPFLKKK